MVGEQRAVALQIRVGRVAVRLRSGFAVRAAPEAALTCGRLPIFVLLPDTGAHRVREGTCAM